MRDNQDKYRFIFNIILIVFGVLLALIFLACDSSKASTKESSKAEATRDINIAWNAYVTALEARDKEKLLALSLPYLICTECMYRSDAYQNPSTALEKVSAYENDQYPEAQQFYTKEFEFEFSPDFVILLKGLVPTFAKITPDQFENISRLFKEKIEVTDEIWMVTVTTTPAGKLGTYHEGGQHIFPFLKTATGYKFGGITNVP